MNKEADDAVLDFASLTPGTALSGGVGEAVLRIADAGVNLLTEMFRSNNRQNHVLFYILYAWYTFVTLEEMRVKLLQMLYLLNT